MRLARVTVQSQLWKTEPGEAQEVIPMEELKKYVRTIPDFPEPGIMFRDVTTILKDAEALRMSIDGLCDLVKNIDFDAVAGAESRGFMFGVPMSYKLSKPFVPVRKPGKLPCETVSQEYDLEYGTATLEVHKDAIEPGMKVVLIDDLMATGGTAEAMVKLVEKLGGEVVAIVFVMELKGLNGRERLNGYNVQSLISYEGK